MSNKHDLEYAQIKQPPTLNLYLAKVKTMDQRTIINYHSEWEKLIKIESDDLSLPEKITNVINSLVLKANALKIKPSSFRVYKASIFYGLAETQIKLDNDLISENDLDNGLNDQFLQSKYATLLNLKVNHAKNSEYVKRTSSLKKKAFPQGFYNYLINLNPDFDSRLFLLIQFVKANILVGLRPIEWLDASICSDIETKCLTLIVQNGKNSNGRANGDFRELKLIDIEEKDFLDIFYFYVNFQNKLKAQVEKFEVQQDSYEKKSSFTNEKFNSPLHVILEDFKPTITGGTTVSNIHINGIPQKGSADLIFKSMRNEIYIQYNKYIQLNPDEDISCERVTLYSTRHQCIANAKANGVNKFEIAGFFGHSDKETSSKHYGKAWSGWGSFKFKPTVESILAVKKSADYVYEEYGIKKADIQPSLNHPTNTSKNEIHINFDI